MQIQQISFKSNNFVTSSDSIKNGVAIASTPAFGDDKYVSQNNKKDNKTLKYTLIGAGLLCGIIALINHKKIGDIFNKGSKDKGTERIADILSGKANSEILAENARKANAEARKIAAMRQKFPELLANRGERRIKFLKNKEKFKQGLLDLDYYKDEFRVNVTVSAERLKILKESNNPELKQMFDLDRKMFYLNDGIMIHGNNDAEKGKLLNTFIDEAKKYDMDVVHIKAGDSDPADFTQQISKLFPEAKQKFLTQKKHTVFVIEDIDKMINIQDRNLSVLNGPSRGSINVNTNNCGSEGVIWISTAKDISKLDESCYRGGRVTNLINIDDTVNLSK